MDNKDEAGNVQSYLEFDPQLRRKKGLRRYGDWYDPNPQTGDRTVFVTSSTNAFHST
jgi:hypothetical protein